VIICPNCGSRIETAFQYCGECGDRIQYCHNCRSANPNSATFCHSCGQELVIDAKAVSTEVRAKASAEVESESSPIKSGSNKTAIAALLIVVMLIAGYVFIAIGPQGAYQGQTPVETSQPVPYTRVQVQIARPSCQWNRDPATDLPSCLVDLTYSVSNAGTMTANARVAVVVDSLTKSDSSFAFSAGASDSRTLSLSFPYDSIHTVEISAYAQDSRDSQTTSIDATLPRNPSDPRIMQLYVTPNDPEIRSTATGVLNNPLTASAKWLALSYFVQDTVRYGGSGTYWQLPRETLQRRTGVCKEYSTLLVSLLRAAGYSTDDVFVVLGTKTGESTGHAWVRIHLDVIGWQELEPQGGIFGIFEGASEVRSGWTARYIFNDQIGYPLSSVIGSPVIVLAFTAFGQSQDSVLLVSSRSISIRAFPQADIRVKMLQGGL